MLSEFQSPLRKLLSTLSAATCC